MSSLPTIRDRYSFANLDEALPLPDLIAIQRESFDWFLDQGLADTFRDISPIKDFTETLQLELEFDPNDEDLRPAAQVLGRGVQGAGHDLLRPDLRAGPVHQRQHR